MSGNNGTEILNSVIAERGGYVDADGRIVSWPISSILNMRLSVISGAGGGVHFFLCELIAQAVASGRTVRVIDIGSSFRKLCQLFSGVHLDRWNPEVWASSANHLVVIDLESIPRNDWEFVIREIQETPAEYWLLATEVWAYERCQIDRANCISSLNHNTERTSQICGFVKSERMPPALSHDAKLFLSRGVEPGVRSPWVLLDGKSEYCFYFSGGERRISAFSIRPPI